MITDTTIAYLNAQIDTGADTLQLFDSWGGLLSPDDFETWSLQYMRQIVLGINKRVPIILFAKGAWHSLNEMKATGAAGLGIDWCIRPEQARAIVGNDVVLQGNFDPAKLLSPKEDVIKSTQKMLTVFGKDHYVANLGHGILPNVPVENARAFVDTVKNFNYSK
jgi:uroporphyrinogen decarboxylase